MRDGLMVESKSSVAVAVAVLFVVASGGDDLGWASSAGVGWVGWLTGGAAS